MKLKTINFRIKTKQGWLNCDCVKLTQGFRIQFCSKTMREKNRNWDVVENIYPNLKTVSLSSIKSLIAQDEELSTELGLSYLHQNYIKNTNKLYDNIGGYQ